jgi:hypothetical protein
VIRLLADENFNGRIVRGLKQQRPQLDLVRVQDLGLTGLPDPDLLEFAADAGRIFLSHDAKTIPAYAYERVRRGWPMPGVFMVRDRPEAIGEAVEEIILLIECGDDEYEGRVVHVPL